MDGECAYKYLLRRGWHWQCVCTSIQLFRVWCGFQVNLHRFYRSQTVFLNQKEASSRNIPSFYHRGIFQVKESKLKNGKSLEFKKKEKKKLKNECEFLEHNLIYILHHESRYHRRVWLSWPASCAVHPFQGTRRQTPGHRGYESGEYSGITETPPHPSLVLH